MLDWLTRPLRFYQLAQQWSSCNKAELDTKAIEREALRLMKSHGLRAEDAWLGAVVSWIYGTAPASQRQALALALAAFVEGNSRFSFDEEAQAAALTIAQQIANEG